MCFLVNQGQNSTQMQQQRWGITDCHSENYVSVKSKLQHPPPPPPPPGIPRAFDTFAVPGRRECDYQSPPGGGEIDPHALGGKAGIWTAPSSSYEVSGVASHHGGRGVRGFLRKRLCLCGQLVTRNGLKQALCRIWRHFCFKIFNTGFRLWIYECISCVYNEIQYLYRRSNNPQQ